MRTTIEISDEILRQARRKAADEGTSLRAVVEAALRTFLTGRPAGTRYRFRWKTERGKLLAGVDLEDRDALFDLMEGRK